MQIFSLVLGLRIALSSSGSSLEQSFGETSEDINVAHATCETSEDISVAH